MRDSVRRLCSSAGFQVQTFDTGRAFLDTYNPTQLGCLVLDTRLPDIDGFDLLRKLSKENITLPSIILTADADVLSAVRAMKSGAVDFIEKPFDDQVPLAAIRSAMEKDVKTHQVRAERIAIALRAARLTPRERQVMQLVVEGQANKVIAARIGCSTKTIEVHRARVMEKMEARNLPDLVRMVISEESSTIEGKPY